MDATIGRKRTLALGQLAVPWLTPRVVEAAVAAIVFLVALAVYNATLTPSLSYQSPDGNELATVPFELTLAHSPGYPLYTWLGKAFTFLPFGDVAHRVNLMSAVGAAGGSALVVTIVLLLARGGLASRRRTSTGHGVELAAGVFGALLLAFSTSLWSQAVIAEVYAPNIFMVALTFVLLLLWGRREEQAVRDSAGRRVFASDNTSLLLFGTFALCFGLSTGTHISNLALAAGFIPFIVLTNWRTPLQPKLVLLGAAAFAIGVAQYAWLPIRAADVNDAFLARNTPTDLEGVYNYTINAFPQLKWAYPIDQLPGRIVMYIDLLRANVGLAGIALAIGGAWYMLYRHTKAFFLLLGAYLAEVIFFLEYQASDIDVFFITSHFIVALAAAYGFYGLLLLASALLQGTLQPPFAAASRVLASNRGRYALAAVASLALLAGATQPVRSLDANWQANDESANTGINDFYELVFERLPQNSTLIGQGGVFGYDMFYYPYVYNPRPDVYIPAMTRFDNARVPQNNPIYTTSPTGGGRGGGPGNRGGVGLPANSYYWPVMSSPVLSETDSFGFANRTLTLYEAKNTAPEIFVRSANPQVKTNLSLGPVTLAGYDIDTTDVEAGGTVHLKLYWQGNLQGRYQVATKVGDTKYIERHEFGFGLVQRVGQGSTAATAGSYLVEEYDLVVLSSTGNGEQPLQIALSGGSGLEWFEIGNLNVSK